MNSSHVSNGTIIVSERMGMSLNALIFFADTLDLFEKIQGCPPDKPSVLDHLKALQSKLTNAISEQEHILTTDSIKEAATISATDNTSQQSTGVDANTSASAMAQTNPPVQPGLTIPIVPANQFPAGTVDSQNNTNEPYVPQMPT